MSTFAELFPGLSVDAGLAGAQIGEAPVADPAQDWLNDLHRANDSQAEQAVLRAIFATAAPVTTTMVQGVAVDSSHPYANTLPASYGATAAERVLSMARNPILSSMSGMSGPAPAPAPAPAPEPATAPSPARAGALSSSLSGGGGGGGVGGATTNPAAAPAATASGKSNGLLVVLAVVAAVLALS